MKKTCKRCGGTGRLEKDGKAYDCYECHGKGVLDDGTDGLVNAVVDRLKRIVNVTCQVPEEKVRVSRASRIGRPRLAGYLLAWLVAECCDLTGDEASRILGCTKPAYYLRKKKARENYESSPRFQVLADKCRHCFLTGADPRGAWEALVTDEAYATVPEGKKGDGDAG